MNEILEDLNSDPVLEGVEFSAIDGELILITGGETEIRIDLDRLAKMHRAAKLSMNVDSE